MMAAYVVFDGICVLCGWRMDEEKMRRGMSRTAERECGR